MQLKIDTHTHTMVSGHAFSTLLENLEAAAAKGLEGIVVSEHTQAVPGAQPNFYMNILKTFPLEHKGVRIIRGVEADITDKHGALAMEPRFLCIAEFVIASLHSVVRSDMGKKGNTSAMIGALENPFVDIIGHPGNPQYDIDQVEVVRTAARLGKMLEINNHSFGARAGSADRCRNVVRLCKEHGVSICVGSDAHTSFAVGGFEKALKVLEEEAFPEELIVSRSRAAFEAYLKIREERLEKAGIKRP